MALVPRHSTDDTGDMDMDMGSMSAGTGVPGYFYMQRMYWVVIGSAIAFATLINLLNKVLLWQRLRTSSSRPRSVFWLSYATATATCREISFASLGTYHFRGLQVRTPPLGKLVIGLSYLITVLVFCFYKYDTADQWSWENIAYRAGCIAQAQLPLIFLLAGKQNVIGSLTGTSYESLNWLHRWIARTLWLTVTLHMGFFMRSWARYDYIKIKLTTDEMTQTGFAAWCILTAIVATSFAPIRRWNYEIFVVQHLVLFAGLVGAVMIHVDDGKVYVWISIGCYFLDRLLRLLVTCLANMSIFHPRRGSGRGIWANQATLTPLPGNVTRVSIEKPLISWKPGQHMFLSCHTVVPLQAHPFTVASLPADEKMEFLVQSKKGGTRRFYSYASKNLRLPESNNPTPNGRTVGIEGPYGRLRPLEQFDSVVFLAGSTGATFTTPLMRDIIRRWKQGAAQAVTRRVRFVWVIKSRDRITWFQEQLEKAMRDTEEIQRTLGDSSLDLDISVYVTCDEELTASTDDATCVSNPRGDAEVTTAEQINTLDEKKTEQDQVVEVKSLLSEDLSGEGCMPGGGCCCKTAVDDEDEAQASCCCCKPSANPGEKGGASPSGSSTVPKSTLKVLAGRPKPKSIIRKVLEDAEGESAVVVCGPRGLQDDVRRSVVALSDERAVHKGTGAQGIYLHIEGFCY